MGATSSTAPTPDAAVRSASRLPDIATPVATTPTVAVSKRALKAQKKRALSLWGQVQALTHRIIAEKTAGRLYSHRADALRAELDDIQQRNHVRTEMEASSLTALQGTALKSDLDALDKEISESLMPAK
jgi:hypothetical protein